MKLFDRFTGSAKKRADEPPFRLFVRVGKPVAVQGWFFTEDVISSLGDALSATNLNWIWESTRTGPPLTSVDDEGNPEHRSRQLITANILNVLQADLMERNLHGFKRFTALYGGSPEISNLVSDDDLRREVEAFAAGNQSVISALIVQFGDVAADVIYFNHLDNPFIKTLLNNLRIPLPSALHQSKYREMKGEELETVMSYLSCAEHDH